MNIAKYIGDTNGDWKRIQSLLPYGWREKAKELGAVKRLRNFKDSDTLLRILLIHFIDGCSLVRQQCEPD